MPTVRKQILLSASQNERLRKLRAAMGISESEIVRRALEAYDPSGGSRVEDDEEVREALEALVEQNAKTAQALDSAEAEIAATERYLGELRAEREVAAERPPAERGARRPRKSARPKTARSKKARERKAAGAGRRS